MENREENGKTGRSSKERMPKDIARLFSWANVEDAPYREFFHLHRRRSKQPLPKLETAEADQAGGSDRAVACDAETLGMAARAAANGLSDATSIDSHPAAAERRGTPRLRAAPHSIASAREAERDSH